MKDDPSNITFHYNREHRLEHAPESVKKMYAEGNQVPHGFLRGLTANAGLKSIFFVIVILSAIVIFMTIFGNPAGSGMINETPVRLKAFLFDETVYATLAIETGKEGITGPRDVLASLSGLDSEGTVVIQRDVSGIYTGKRLLLRATLPDYEIKTLQAAIKIDKSETILTVAVDRK